MLGSSSSSRVMDKQDNTTVDNKVFNTRYSQEIDPNDRYTFSGLSNIDTMNLSSIMDDGRDPNDYDHEERYRNAQRNVRKWSHTSASTTLSPGKFVNPLSVGNDHQLQQPRKLLLDTSSKNMNKKKHLPAHERLYAHAKTHDSRMHFLQTQLLQKQEATIKSTSFKVSVGHTVSSPSSKIRRNEFKKRK